jgi:hypothetical protein
MLPLVLLQQTKSESNKTPAILSPAGVKTPPYHHGIGRPIPKLLAMGSASSSLIESSTTTYHSSSGRTTT